MAPVDPFEAVTAWALGVLQGKPRDGKKERRSSPRVVELAECYGLDALDRNLVELAWAAAGSFAVARAAGTLSVERMREALSEPEVDERLAPGSRLRTH